MTIILFKMLYCDNTNAIFLVHSLRIKYIFLQQQGRLILSSTIENQWICAVGISAFLDKIL